GPVLLSRAAPARPDRDGTADGHAARHDQRANAHERPERVRTPVSAMKLFSETLLDELTLKATASPRGRAHYNLHSSSAELVQRFFLVVNRHSYVRPHRHLTKSELGLVVRGQFDIVTFDDHGRVTARYVVGDDAQGIG